MKAKRNTINLARLFLIFVCVLFNNTVSANELSLEPLVEEAKRNNPEIAAALKRYESAKARIPQAKSPEDPQIGIEFEKAKGNPFNLRSTPAMDRKLSVSQMFPWFGRLSLKGKIALVESQIYAAEYKDKELEVINATKKAYYDLFMSNKEISLKQESLEFVKFVIKIAEARYAAGGGSQNDIFKLNLELTKMNNEIENLEKEKSVKKVRLNSLLNRQADSYIGEPVLKEEIKELSYQADYLYKLTLQNQPELLIFSYAIEKNKNEKELAKKSFFPDLMAGIVMRGLASGSIGPWDLMMAFSVPLWSWTKQRYQVKEAIANLEEAEAAYQAMKNKAFAETKNLIAQVEIAANKVKLYKESQIPLLQSSINSLVSSYRSGQADIMLLIDSERMLIEARMDYYKSLVDYNMNLAELERNVGVDLSNPKERI